MEPAWKDRVKAQPLWFWGFCFCFGGVFALLATMMLIQAADLRRSQEQAAQIGAAVAGNILILIGVVFFVRHFRRRKDG